MNKYLRISLVGFLLLGTATSNAWGAVLYTVTDLGTLGGTASGAWGVNNSGQVVGWAATSGGVWHAFRTAANQPINTATDDLGALDSSSSQAWGINDSGQVVGFSYTSGGPAHGFRTAPNQRINPGTDDLGTLGGTRSYANAINASGQVVGESDVAPQTTHSHAFRTAANQPINPATDDLGTLGGTMSYAYGINDSGQVVGRSNLPGDMSEHAFLWSNGQMTDLGTLGGRRSEAFAINNGGQVVGGAYTIGADPRFQHAFRTAPNQPINPATDDLGTLGGWESLAYGINDRGQVVGYAYTDASGGHAVYNAFLYSGSGPMLDLNNLIDPASGWTLTGATGINDSGQIVGYGTHSGQEHTFLMTPIPEPSTFALLASAASLLAYAWRRRKR